MSVFLQEKKECSEKKTRTCSLAKVIINNNIEELKSIIESKYHKPLKLLNFSSLFGEYDIFNFVVKNYVDITDNYVNIVFDNLIRYYKINNIVVLINNGYKLDEKKKEILIEKLFYITKNNPCILNLNLSLYLLKFIQNIQLMKDLVYLEIIDYQIICDRYFDKIKVDIEDKEKVEDLLKKVKKFPVWSKFKSLLLIHKSNINLSQHLGFKICPSVEVLSNIDLIKYICTYI